MYIADLHIHSRYSRATSRDCDPEHLDLWARRKGINLIGTGDFTHPAWRKELMEKLEPMEEGLFALREDFVLPDSLSSTTQRTRFVLSGEISSIYKKNGRVRKVHNVILLPSFDAAEELSHKLEAIGNIHSDGRPILGLDSRDLLEITLETCPNAVFIPAHIWTPHFSLFGAFSGFDTIEECFEDLTPYIHALETGLSSDPPMNARISALDSYTLVSNSDAHSPSKLGREANLLDAPLSFPGLAGALRQGWAGGFLGTIEFFPEEGKYHYDGHRSCKLCLAPGETIRYGGVCPACGKKITIGVQHRVEELADRPEGYERPDALPYESLVPLPEVIAASVGMTTASKKVNACYEAMLHALGTEFSILRSVPLEEIERVAGPCVREGIHHLRTGRVERLPGYDGEYGKIKLLEPAQIALLNGQTSLFGMGKTEKPKKSAAPPSILKDFAARVKKKPEQTASQNTAVLLNEEQRRAVVSDSRAIAVTAGPGTGKTRTLVARLQYLLDQGLAKPSEITAVTFTNQAAAELRSRLETALGSKRALRGITVGTFHSICMNLLQDVLHTPVVLADEAASEELAEKLLKAEGLKLSPTAFLREISRLKNGLVSDTPLLPEGVLDAYCAAQKQAGLRDFDDLLLDTLALWESGSPISATVKKKFRWLLVDEFQDINRIQYRLLRAWLPKNGNLFAIGDPDQAIYGFRGSEPQCFKRLKLDYPGLTAISLSENYRSSPAILRCALPAISKNPGAPRILHAQQPETIPVKLLHAEDEFAQALFVAKEINRMAGGIDMLEAHQMAGKATGETPRGFSDIAVLYRTHRQARLIEKCLRQESIPYIVTGRDDVLHDKTVRGLLGFFRFLLRPEDTDSLRSSLKFLWGCPEGVFESMASNTAQWAEDRLGDTLAALAQTVENAAVSAWAALAAAFLPRLKKEKPRRLLEDITAQLGLEETEPLEKLKNMAVFHKTIAAFLEALLLGEEPDIKRACGQSYAAGAVTLMTLHGAKGLEFPVVFLCGLKKGTVPLESTRFTCDAEEERRLFYVGITRAKEELLLLAPDPPSAFLEDLPKGELFLLQQEKRRKQEGAKQLCLF